MAMRCAACDRSFDTQEALEVHRNEDHGQVDAQAVGERFTCSDCGAELSSKSSLDMHRHDAHTA
jgi:DNA-directed RNA polymerase subunit RPC12/RpoP